MRLCRYAVGSGAAAEVGFGVVEGAGPDGLDSGAVVAAVDGHPFAPFSLTGVRHSLAAVRLLAPVLPSKIVCVGKNYADHAREMGSATGTETPVTPIIFLKPSTSVVGPGDAIAHPRDSERVDYEGELAVVISRLCRDVPRERAADVVLGFTIANDVTARDQQQTDGQWTRAKGHDTFCPLGPWVDTDVDPADLRLETRLDGEVVQSARTSLMLHDVAGLIAFVTSFATLLPGDVLLTGTPAGVGAMRPGQRVDVTVGGIGTLSNPVVARG